MVNYKTDEGTSHDDRRRDADNCSRIQQHERELCAKRRHIVWTMMDAREKVIGNPAKPSPRGDASGQTEYQRHHNDNGPVAGLPRVRVGNARPARNRNHDQQVV